MQIYGALFVKKTTKSQKTGAIHETKQFCHVAEECNIFINIQDPMPINICINLFQFDLFMINKIGVLGVLQRIIVDENL